ncbi:MAG: hypothetical protein KI792_01565 [Alphaproteobacteria bacterium]|nr:hypothetical protein [Alphaproteobacteria bacterium SS10]
MVMVPGAQAKAQGTFTCPETPAATYTLAIDSQDVQIIENAGPEQLRGLYDQHNRAHGHYGSSPADNQHAVIGGLHHGELRLRSEIKMLQATRSDSSMACLGVQVLELSLVYKPVIYISRTKPRGSCEYQAALQHEYKHLTTDLRILRDWVPSLRDAAKAGLDKVAQPMRVRATDLARARDDIQRRVVAPLDRVMDQVEAERDRQQSAIDTPEEYERVARQCP